MKEVLEGAVRSALAEIGAPGAAFAVEYPPAGVVGDYSITAAFAAGKVLGKSPREVAELLRDTLLHAKVPYIADISIAGAGFLNITLAPDYFAAAVASARVDGEKWGSSATLSGKTIMVEYTDPNPFKEFHIGHLMSNAIGESVSRLLAASGAKIIRANYYGDVGPHVAKAIWGMMNIVGQGGADYPDTPHPNPLPVRGEGADQNHQLQAPRPSGGEDADRQVRGVGESALTSDVSVWGRAYQLGSAEYEENPLAKAEIDRINKAVYEKSDPAVNELYAKGRAVSLAKFEEIYKILGTHFDEDFPESATFALGVATVKAHPEIFEESEGAIVFKGEKYGLHTRVFINRNGLPTYETKELGLAELKCKRAQFDRSITVTAVEQKDYFNVVFTALFLMHPEWKDIFEHIHHGMMTLPTGKMSSRKGTVVTGESLINEMIAAATEKMGGREVADPVNVAQMVAVAAIKYSVLKQTAGKNIVFDPAQSLSFEGDSGPYLQYAHARCCSVLRKGREAGVETQQPIATPHSNPLPSAGEGAAAQTSSPSPLEGEGADRRMRGSEGFAPEVTQLLARFPEIVERAAAEYEPHFITHYLIELAGTFNAWYANTRVLDGTADAPGKLALVDAVRQTLKNGLWLLGCSAPEEM